ncbi:MAG: tetratricopeptide repeat protein [Cyanobium sp. CZS 25K]|nr:tetratricopeptide repeat protein [Cyanobium sp. CZS25K]
MDAFGALIEEGKLHEARPLLQAALLLMPQNAPALYYLGLLASEEGDLEEARSLLNRAALASAGNVSIQPHALEALALVAVQQGDRAEARRALEKVIEWGRITALLSTLLRTCGDRWAAGSGSDALLPGVGGGTG